MSRGGFGAWSLAIQYPEYFAAIAPICGVSNPNYAGWLPDIPIWIFHGEDDSVIPVSESIEMYDALKAKGRNVKLTLYPDTDHDSWTKTFENPELYEWMLEQRR